MNNKSKYWCQNIDIHITYRQFFGHFSLKPPDAEPLSLISPSVKLLLEFLEFPLCIFYLLTESCVKHLYGKSPQVVGFSHTPASSSRRCDPSASLCLRSAAGHTVTHAAL